jgi:SAM-dependent methyltransferase
MTAAEWVGAAGAVHELGRFRALPRGATGTLELARERRSTAAAFRALRQRRRRGSLAHCCPVVKTAGVNLDALWHDLECGDYREDLPLWRSLAARTGGPVLDVGAGTGRVTLDLASGGLAVVALDIESALLAALAHRAAGLPVETILADARSFELARRFPLVLVPMQTLQLLGGPQGRAAFLRRARAHMEPGGLLAAAVADPMDCFDDVRALPPPAAARWVADVCYSSQLLAVVEDDGRAAIHRRREILGPSERRYGEDVVIHLDRLSASDVAADAAALDFVVEPSQQVPETERYLGCTVAMLRAPRA